LTVYYLSLTEGKSMPYKKSRLCQVFIIESFLMLAPLAFFTLLSAIFVPKKFKYSLTGFHKRNKDIFAII